MDDFEIYLRCQTYDLKINRAIEKFISRVKWLPLSAGLDVFKESHLLLRRQREALFEESKRGEERVRQRFNHSMMKKTDDLITRVEGLLSGSFPCNYQSKTDFTLRAPTRITNLMELHADILHRANQFDLQGDIEIDDGHSFTYQVHMFFTMYFQKQVIKSQFGLYDHTVRQEDDPPDDDLGDVNEVERRNLCSLLLIDFQLADLMNTNSDQSNLYLLKKG